MAIENAKFHCKNLILIDTRIQNTIFYKEPIICKDGKEVESIIEKDESDIYCHGKSFINNILHKRVNIYMINCVDLGGNKIKDKRYKKPYDFNF